MTKSILIMVFSLFVISTNLSANENNTKETRVLSDIVMKNILKGDFQAAINSLKSYWVIDDAYLTKFLEEIKKQWPVLNKKYGKDMDFEFLKTEVIGKSYIRQVYLYKFEKHAIRWSISFYIAKDKWQVNNVNFDEALESLFEDIKEK